MPEDPLAVVHDGSGGAQTAIGDLSTRMDFVRQIHSNVAENIRLADAKAGLIAAGAAALLNVLASRARAELGSVITSFEAQPVLSGARLLVLIIAVVSSVLALLFAYFALRPRLRRPRSFIAFPELARMSTEEYLERIDVESDVGLIRELANDTIGLSIIALTKNRMVSHALKPLIGTAVCVAVLLLLG
jgi:hypothetical protein